MTDAPEEIHIKPNRDYTSIWGRPVVTDPFDDDPETAGYIRADIHDAAVSAARKEGMLEAARRLGEMAEQTPLGHESVQRGASTHNWLRYCEKCVLNFAAETTP